MLYIVPTPIGNLKDITLRALEVLKNADLIVCEDTRHTRKLLDHYEIGRTPLESFHDHSDSAKVVRILKQVREGRTVALVTDSGMPLISDPGFEIVREAVRLEQDLEVLPGANAALTALAGSGLPVDSFSFQGFLPPKSAARKRKLESLSKRQETLIFYESPFRVLKALEDMREVLGNREAAAAREITKKFEEYSRGYLSDLIVKFKKQKPVGEFVLLVAGLDRKETLHR